MELPWRCTWARVCAHSCRPVCRGGHGPCSSSDTPIYCDRPRVGCRACGESRRSYGDAHFYLSFLAFLSGKCFPLYEPHWHGGPRADYRHASVSAQGEGCGQAGPGHQAQSGWGEGPVDLEDTWPTFTPAGGGVQALSLGPPASPSPCGTRSPRPQQTGAPQPVLNAANSCKQVIKGRRVLVSAWTSPQDRQRWAPCASTSTSSQGAPPHPQVSLTLTPWEEAVTSYLL